MSWLDPRMQIEVSKGLTMLMVVNFQDMQATSRSMLEEIRYIRRSLNDNFEASTDGYTRKMFRFAASAEEELKELRDGITQAEKALREVQTYYGEGEEMGRPIPSQEFFGIFRTFTSSYKVCSVKTWLMLVLPTCKSTKTGRGRREGQEGCCSSCTFTPTHWCIVRRQSNRCSSTTAQTGRNTSSQARTTSCGTPTLPHPSLKRFFRFHAPLYWR